MSRLALLLGLLALALALAGPASASKLSVSLEPGGTRADADRLAASLGGRVVDAIPQLRAYLIEMPARVRAHAALRELAADPLVRSARPNARDELDWDIDDTYRHLLPHLSELGAFEAWDTTRGDPEVVIGIVDSGVLLDHPDLAGRVVPGRDVADGDDDPTDTVGHGTLVAGIAGAAANNATGVAGICPACTLLVVKALRDNQTSLTKFESAQGIVWAVDHGADVLNLSFGGETDDPVQAAAVEYAIARGVVVVASAGNRSAEAPQFPAAYDGVVAVAATDDPYRLWEGSSFGPWVDLAAPGVRIFSTLHDGTYTYGTGTSFAAPMVAAAAGLALAAAPGAPAAQVVDALVTGTVPLVNTPIRKLNLPRTLRRALGGPIEPDPPPPLLFDPFAVSPGAWFLDDWRPPAAGEPFAAGARVRRDDTDEFVEAGQVTCRARVGRRTLRVVEASFTGGFAICVWHIPAKGTARKQVKGTVIAEALGGKVEQTFSMNVRRYPG
jgi:thermitase